jgi:hypothetical protein
MKRVQLIVIVFLSLVWISPAHCRENVSYQAQAEKIRNTFESALFTFSPGVQKHYALRMYRVTGDERYVYPVVFNLLTFLDKLRYDSIGLNQPAYIQARAQQVINHEFNLGATDPEARRAALIKGGDVAFYLMLAKNLNSLREYNLVGAKVFPESTRLIEALKQKKEKLAAFLLDDELMKISGAQLVNYVYYLYFLDVVDIRKQYLDGLERALMQGRPDPELSKGEYTDKVYGLTHVVLAASDYFQYKVQRKEFSWILDYFEKNIDTIIARTKPDVYAEVGLSFLLAGYSQDNHALRRVQEQILSDIDQDKGMILSVKGGDDLRSGEHRNVLAIMLLDWPETLTPGPDLRTMAKFQKLLPIQERD